MLQTLPSLPSRGKTAQVQPSPPLLSQSSPTPLTILPHDVRVRPSEKNRRVDVFRVVFFSRECFCYLPVPCETSHAAPTAAELLFFSTSPSSLKKAPWRRECHYMGALHGWRWAGAVPTPGGFLQPSSAGSCHLPGTALALKGTTSLEIV